MIKKIFLLFVLVTVLAFLFNSFCFAQGRELEIEYPEVPGVETPTKTKTALPEFLKYIFTFAIIIAGLLAFGALIYGGIRYLTSAGDPTKMADARAQVTAGILGLIILLSSYLILNTINPQLVLPEKPPLQPAVAGIYAYVKANCLDDPENSYDDRVLINADTPDLSERLPKDKNGAPQSLQCIEFRSGKEDLTVKVYSNVNYSPEPPDECEDEPGEAKNVTGKSIKMDYHSPGVYLYSNSTDCGKTKINPGRPIEEKIYQSGSATLPEFDNRTNSIKFVPGDFDEDLGKYQLRFSAVLHEKENYMGEAAVFDINDIGENNCYDLSNSLKGQVVMNNKVSSITVYLKPKFKKDGSEQIVGLGVRFWEDKNCGGFARPSKTEYYGKDTGIWELSYIGDDYNDRVTSMEIDGNYVALLFRHPNYKGDCDVFPKPENLGKKRYPDFRNYRIGQCSYVPGFPARRDCLSSFIIKARK